MPKLICGLSKNVGRPGRETRGASITLEVELEIATLRDPATLKRHIRCGFDRSREAIEEELARPCSAGTEDAVEPDSNGRGRVRRVRPATSSQLRLLRVLAGRRDVQLADLVRERCGREDAAELSLSEAS